MKFPRQLTSRYEMHESIGRGGMGEVFRATHRASGEGVAIKALRFELAPDPSQVERFLREGEALRRLSHPNIVKCRESFECEGHFFLVLDYISGGSLRQRGPLEVGQALDIMLDVADALTRAHRLQIVHRDVKPDNILVSDDGHGHLTDFGVAYLGSAWTPLTIQGTALGTVAYMSPEACQAQPACPAQDIWSFGVTLFELLAGRLPFAGDSPGHLILAILTGTPLSLAEVSPQIPAELVSLVDRLLQRDPAARIASMREVGLELERLAGALGPIGPVPRAAPLPVEPSVSDSLPGYVVVLEAGEVLWRQGDPSDFVAYLEEGELEVVGSSSEGATLVFTVLKPGEILGEMSCLDGKEHSATVRARFRACVRKLGRHEFLNWLRTDPERMQSLLLKQSERLRRVAGRLVHSQEPLRVRLASWLLEHPGETVQVTHQGLAAQLGVHRDSVSRALRQLAGEGLIRLHRGGLEILERDGLQRL
jgi:CRP-like cAMP-binding protein